MRGIINTETNERQRPGVNSPTRTFYKVGDVVDIVDAVTGDPYEGDDLWYKLTNGCYLWSGGVDIEADSAGLAPEDHDQYMISYRNILPDGRPNMNSKSVPDKLYFTPVRLPAESESIRVNELLPELFADGVMQSVRKFHRDRKNVLIYIHGYQPLLPSLKLDLFLSLVKSYLTHPLNTIAKVIFMSWPAHGGAGRKTTDDRSLKMGEHFSEKGMFETFKVLSDKLKAEGRALNLIVHSFGHQLLNGMINPFPTNPANLENVFENIFLMAPDITVHVTKKGGKTLNNYFKDRDGRSFLYLYAGLKVLAKNVYVFHDKYDYLLYSSTKKFVGPRNLKGVDAPEKRFEITGDYRNLGNYGRVEIDQTIDDERFEYVDVDELVTKGAPGKFSDFPFRHIKGTRPANEIEKVYANADYSGINGEWIIFNINRFGNHHRYLFTCKPVVEKVLKLMLGDSATP
jgi:hypothetical protein